MTVIIRTQSGASRQREQEQRPREEHGVAPEYCVTGGGIRNRSPWVVHQVRFRISFQVLRDARKG